MKAIKFTGLERVKTILNNGDFLVKNLLQERQDVCSLIDSKTIKLVEKLGKGAAGVVYSVELPGNQVNKYAVKIAHSLAIKTYKITRPFTLKQVTEAYLLDKRYENIVIDVIYKLNGNDPKRVFKKGENFYLPMFATGCKLEESVTFPKVGGVQGATEIPKGSYLCDNESYSEYAIGVLVSELYKRNLSINFIDILDFVSCYEVGKTRASKPKPLQYIFMQQIGYSLDSTTFLDVDVESKDSKQIDIDEMNALIIQLLYAIACYQTYFKISHNDLHLGNIFLEPITAKTMFSGKKLEDFEYFMYIIGDDRAIAFPRPKNILKIGDWGLSVKYSQPIVGDLQVFVDGYNDGELGAWVPNWYSPVYDLLYSLNYIYYHTRVRNVTPTDFLRSILYSIIDGDPKLSLSEQLSDYILGYTMRPVLKKLTEEPLVNKSAYNVLLSDLMSEYVVDPSTIKGKYIIIGRMAPI